VPKPSMPLMAQLLTPHVLIKIHMKSHLRRFVIIPRLSSISQVIFAIQFLEKIKILEYSSALVFSFSCFYASPACLPALPILHNALLLLRLTFWSPNSKTVSKSSHY